MLRVRSSHSRSQVGALWWSHCPPSLLSIHRFCHACCYQLCCPALISESQMFFGLPLCLEPSTILCITLWADDLDCLVTYPNHCNFFLLVTSNKGPYSSIKLLIFFVTSMFVTFCFHVMPWSASILRKLQFFSPSYCMSSSHTRTVLWKWPKISTGLF